MLNIANNIFNNKDVGTFVKTMTEAVSSTVEKYWEQNVKITMLAINNFEDFRKEKFISKIDFFSSKIAVEKHNPIIIRLSKECIKNFFDVTLDAVSDEFSLSALTKLEIRIINNFCEFLYKKIKEELIPVKGLKMTPDSDRYVNMMFFMSIADKNSIFAISVPVDRAKIDPIKDENSFTDDDFLTSEATVNLRVGKTKVTLEELENLSLDDIVLLEESSASKLTLVSGGFEKEFTVKADSTLVMSMGGEDDEISIDNEVIMEKNLWDDIQIEVNAEFEKVKMSIGEIKKITQGQIVDLGSVFNNEISLFVENKKVAKGELIIINDRYAVQLTEVVNKKPTPAAPKPQQAPPKQEAPAQAKPQQPPQAPPKPPQAPPPPPPKQEDENFDYSDFEK